MRASRAIVAAASLAAVAGVLAGATTQPATQPARASQAGEAVLDSLDRLHAEDLAPPQAAASASLMAKVEALRRIQIVPRPRGRTMSHILAARQAPLGPGKTTTRPASATSRPASPATQPTTASPHLPRAVLEKLKALPDTGLSLPGELADELYRSGLREAAYVLYERGLKASQDPNAQAWSLYQMANCRHDTDPAAAEALYTRVVAEHGKSLWSRLAAVERKLLMWHRVNQPDKLLQSIQSVDEILKGTGRNTTARGAASQPADSQPAATGRASTGPATRPVSTQPATRPAALPAARPASTQPAAARSGAE